MKYAETLFEEMNEGDVISWSVMIQGYMHTGEIQFGLDLFNKMILITKTEVDGRLMVTLLNGCSILGDLNVGKSFHGFAFMRGINSDLFVGNTLVDFCGKCTDFYSAIKVFSEMTYRNIVSWNSILYGFVHNKRHRETFQLLHLMEKSGVDGDEVTLVNLLQSCKILGVLDQSKSIHSRVIRRGFQLNEMVINSLIDAYAKSNKIEYAQILFCQINKSYVVTWSTMIYGFTHCGMPDEAISLYRELRESLEIPNSITLLNLIETCSLCSELRRSKCVHGMAVRMDLASNVVLGTAILEMYSKCGAIKEPRRAFDQIFKKYIVAWSAKIVAYGLNGLPHEALALHSEMKSHGLKPNSVTALSVLSACWHGSLIEEGLSIFIELSKNHVVELNLEHYSCLVDLLARFGDLTNALNMIKYIPDGLKPTASAWGALLSASRNYQIREFASRALHRFLN